MEGNTTVQSRPWLTQVVKTPGCSADPIKRRARRTCTLIIKLSWNAWRTQQRSAALCTAWGLHGRYRVGDAVNKSLFLLCSNSRSSDIRIETCGKVKQCSDQGYWSKPTAALLLFLSASGKRRKTRVRDDGFFIVLIIKAKTRFRNKVEVQAEFSMWTEPETWSKPG